MVAQSWRGWEWRALLYHTEVKVSYRLPLTTLGDKVRPRGINTRGHAEDGKGFCCLSYSVHEGAIQIQGAALSLFLQHQSH